MATRKELKEQYKNMAVIGGIYCIRCQGNGRTWIDTARDIRSKQSQFQFSVANNFCPRPGMHKEWSKYGAESFSFSVLEEIEKRETQTDQEFAEDIKTLFEIWREKQAQSSVEG